ncbi:DUF938 domain-containing protein [Thalassotalea euphylliae]|uniref:DUF938 domain-containing protein n=1 Tax=Thalassotalea euphylliae TaxID=1655234 RepID=A0A3E0UIY8_9GAMM|nr:DUF938 domain-containing protein [Thalassotalea euphylliae]REL36968.1 DUF938 domain-containing protein [Thalassotalea euphylliae]
MNELEQAWQNFAPSCERNKAVIWQTIEPYLADKQSLLEIGSLSGQHACYFSGQLPQLSWQCSDIAPNLPPLTANIKAHGSAHMLSPIELDVANALHWPKTPFDVIYTANTLHIMSWQHVIECFANMSVSAKSGTLFIAYGPFNFSGNYSSESNAEFDIWLKERDSQSAIRDFEAVDDLAKQAGMELVANIDMPANNQLLVWQFNT